MNFLIAKDGSTQKQVTLTKQLRLTINAGQAKPTPPVGPALGQYGVNLMDFCKLFNDITKDYNSSIPLTCRIKIQPTKQFSFTINVPTNTFFLRNGIPLAQSTLSDPRTLTSKTLYELAYIRYIFYNVYVDYAMSARHRARYATMLTQASPQPGSRLDGLHFKPDHKLRFEKYESELTSYFFTSKHYNDLLLENNLETTHLKKIALSFLGSYDSFQFAN